MCSGLICSVVFVNAIRLATGTVGSTSLVVPEVVATALLFVTSQLVG